MQNSDRLSELLTFFRIERSDLEAMAKIRPVVEEHADTLVDHFYQHLDGFTETRLLLADENVRNRLLRAQREYLLSLTEPTIDQQYIEQRSQIGKVHERVGLDTRWYLGAYALYFSMLVPLIREFLSEDPAASETTVIALAKRLDFDAEIAIRQYIDRREQQLQVLNAKLRDEGRTLSREVEQTHDDLRRIETRAEQAEQLASVATLISGLAHEIGTPMGVIRGHAEALGGAVEGERATWRLNMILEQIDRITGIIHALLNMARPRESVRIAVDLAATLDATLAFLTEKLKRRSVDISKSVDDIPEITGDPEKLQQVFLNLLINAVDAMPEGGTLSIAIERDGAFVLVKISDSGAGISDRQLTSIFDPFYTTKPAGRGSGLGLVVVKGIVDEHGGSIGVRSEPGQGAVFSVRLPVDS
jgi:signal transduction histidine kinase